MDAVINKPIYTLDERNEITVHAEEFEPSEGVFQFRSQAELVALGAKWPSSRLLDIWNRLPKVTPVKRFTSRQTAMRRIWDALQPPKTAQEVPKQEVTRTKTKKQRVISKRLHSKSEVVIALLRQGGGATLQALMAATGWQAHSVRGFISGQITKKMRLKVRSFTRDGLRVYSIRS